MRPLAWLCALAAMVIAAPARAQGSAERGKYVFDAAGCLGCHTDKDGPPMAGGPPLKTPFGTFYAPNITPDPTHGIGKWSEGDFRRALREGVSPGRDHYFPVFPYSAYTRMTAQDMADLWAYLRTVRPSAEPSRAHEVGFPYSLRMSLGPWKWLYFSSGEFKPDAGKDAAYNRGAYLAEALVHCGECHTPRNMFGGLKRDAWMTGARMPVGDLVATNLTPDKTGLADWSTADIVDLLATGTLPEGSTVTGEMGEVVRNSTSKLRPEDREAIAAYLKALPAQPTTVKKKEK